MKSLPQGDELLAHMSTTVADTAVEHRRRLRRKKEVPPSLRVSLELVANEAGAISGGNVEEEALARIAAEEIYKAVRETSDLEIQGLAALSILDYSERAAARKLGLTAGEVDAARQRLRRRGPAIARRINADTPMSERKEDD